MVRTSPSLATNQRALERRDAPLSSRRNDDSAGSSHRDHRSQGRDESPRRASSYNEHSSSSHRDRRRPDRDDRSDYPLDNDFSAHSPYSHHPRAMQPSSRALREKHSEEKDLIETYEAEIKRIQDLRKQLLMPASSNGPPAPSRRAASPPSVSFDMSHNEYSAPSRSSYTAEYERDRNSANRLSDPFRASPPPAMPIIVNRRGTDPIRAPEQQHMLQQDRLGLYFGGQAVPVLQRNISDSQRTSNGDGYLCDVDEDDGEERRRRESEATDFVDENDDESDSGSDGRAEGQEDEGGAGRHPKSLSSVVLTLKHPEPHSSGLMRGGAGRSPPMGPKAVPVYDPSAMDSMSAPSQPLSSALRAPAPPFKRSSPQMQGVNGDVPDLPSLASAARSHYAVPDQLPSRHSPVDHGNHSKPNFVPAYNVPVLGRRDDRDQAPLPPASASSPLSPSAQAAAAQKQARPFSAEAEALRVQSDALRALQLTVGAHDSVPAKSCCAVM